MAATVISWRVDFSNQGPANVWAVIDDPDGDFLPAIEYAAANRLRIQLPAPAEEFQVTRYTVYQERVDATTFGSSSRTWLTGGGYKIEIEGLLVP